MYDGQKENETYTFVRNPYFDRGESDVDVFHVKVIPDNDAKVLALRNGEIDMIVGQANLTYNTFEELSTAPGFTAVSSDATIQSRTMGFNVSHAPFNDPAVRLAANHAIDTQSISTNIFYGVETSADSWFWIKSYPIVMWIPELMSMMWKRQSKFWKTLDGLTATEMVSVKKTALSCPGILLLRHRSGFPWRFVLSSRRTAKRSWL